MRLSARAARALSIATIAALVGCQGLANGVTPARPQASAVRRPRGPLSAVDPRAAMQAGPTRVLPPMWMRSAPAATGARAYASQFNFTDVNEYPANDKKNVAPLCQIPNQQYVNGIGVDAARNLWVPQGGEFTGVITEFAPDCGKVLLQIQDGEGQPGAVAFDAKKNVYIENIMGPSGSGSIDVYASGATQPKRVLHDSQAFRWFDLAIDKAADVFVAYADLYNKGHIIEFPRGKSAPKSLISLGFPGGVALDGAGNLLVVDQDAANVSVYAPPFTGKPLGTFGLQADSVPCRFNHRQTLLYCADFVHASIDVYRYDAQSPSASSYAYSFNNGIRPQSSNDGIALSPAPPL